MIPELGNYACIIALCFAFLLMLSPLLCRNSSPKAQLAFANTCSRACALFILIGFFSLVYAFLVNDFTVTYVIRHSHYLLPWYYRIGAVWGGHEGSLLLWISILALWMSLVTHFPKQLELSAQTKLLAILGALLFGFLAFLLLTSNPFTRMLTRSPVGGQDLNPLLQDPGLMIHPPILYMGYVGFAITFAYGVVGLLEGRLSKAWLAACRQWTMIAWAFLGFGIVLGSWWSYRELGWGGWWFWDPVENASLLPWLVATSLIHSLIVSDKRQAFQGWTVLLALLCFALSLLGTFLVRSGVLISVHAFSNDPSRGIYLLFFLFVVIGASLFLYALRGSQLYRPSEFSLLSRESVLLINNVFFLVITATILLGTLYPIILDSLGLGKISVGEPYFNKVFIPLMLPLVLLMGFAPNLRWQHVSIKQVLQQQALRFGICAIMAIITPLLFDIPHYTLVSIGLFLTLWVLSSVSWKLSTLTQLPSVGMKLAHWGLGLCLLGITLSSFYNQQTAVDMKVGDVVNLAGYHFKLDSTQKAQTNNYNATKANFLITQDHPSSKAKQITTEQRIYTVNQTPLTKTGIEANAWRDLYVVIGPQLTQGYWTVRVYFKPFIRWIWLGGLLMVFGGILTLFKLPKRRNESLCPTN